jgi:D-alanine-D-alanine ligase
MKLIVAAICGGYSSEKVISHKSVGTIIDNLDENLYDAYKVEITQDEWICHFEDKTYPVNKNHFGVDELKIKFDFAYIMIHGTPGEDGKLQAYFDMINVPYAGCSQLMSTITFDKWACNNLLSSFGVKCALSVLIRPGASYDKNQIVEKLSLPIFVKPNDGGSSFGITKVNKVSELDEAILKAMNEGSNAILESFIDGYEITIGAFRNNQGIQVLPITQILTDNEFFDYQAKYDGASSEITPAEIPDDDAKKARAIVKNVYELLGLEGIVRIDFIVSNDELYMIEINAVPGFSPASIVPQQIRADGRTIKETLTEIIELANAPK